jgi:hypothetical protein
MEWLDLLAAACFLGAGLAVIARWLKKKGDRWAAAFVAAATILGMVAITFPRMPRPVVAVIVLDQPLPAGPAPDFNRLVERLSRTRASRLTLVVVDPSVVPPVLPVSWVDVGQQGAADLLRSNAIRVPEITQAISTAVGLLEPAGRLEAGIDFLLGRASRIVVGVTDPRRWNDWKPLDVDNLLVEARRGEVLIDRVDLSPRPLSAVVEIEAPLGLPSEHSLNQSPVSLIVTLRAPELLSFARTQVEVKAEGRLDGGKALLSGWTSNETVRSTGEINFMIPLSRFAAQGRTDLFFNEGFVRCDLDLKIKPGGREIQTRGTAYLPVRKSTALVVCGTGRGASRLLSPRLLGPNPAESGDEVVRIKDRANALKTARAASAAQFEFIAEAELSARLADRDRKPAFIILHECSAPSFWNANMVKQLDEAVRDGIRLIVVDPPTLPINDPVLADQIAALLPALAMPDPRMTTPTPHTSDALAILNLVFDYGRAGDFEETPGKSGNRTSLPSSINVQFAAAKALLGDLRGRNLIKGSLRSDPNTGEIRYQEDPEDRILVRVAPRLNASHSLVDTLFGSSIEPRIAPLFAEAMPGLIAEPPAGSDDPTGVRPPPSVRSYPAGDPMFTPRQALVVFTGNVPQPLPEPYARPIDFTFGNGPVRVATQPPADITAKLLLRGITTAVIRLDVPDYDAGLEDLTRHWPDSGPNLLATFRSNPEQILQGALSRLGTFATDSWLRPDQAKARLLRNPTGGVFFDTIDLGQGRPLDKARRVGDALANKLSSLLGSPRETRALAVVEPSMDVDGRAGPVLTPSMLTPGPGAAFSPLWKEADRWAAPDRFRWLIPSPGWSDESRSTQIVAVDVGREAARIAPIPMLISGVRGGSRVSCFAYSPLETSESWRELHDRICLDNLSTAGETDLFGPSRLIDPITFAARLLPSPIDRPIVRSVVEPDRRGGCDLVVAFRPDQSATPAFWEPRLIESSTGGRIPLEERLELKDVSWADRCVTFRLTPEAASRLCSTRDGIEVVPVLDGRPDDRHRFFLARPMDADWLELSALTSLTTLAGYSGGSIGGDAEMAELTRSTRTPAILGLAIAMTGLALARSRWRWLRWFRPVPGTESRLERLRTIATNGLDEDLSQLIAPPRGSRRGQLEIRRPIGPGSRIENVRTQSLLRFILGIPGIPEEDIRMPPGIARLDLVVNLGESMRSCLGRDRTHLKVRFLGVVCQFIAECYWQVGASVRLIGLGLEGGPRVLGPLYRRGNPGEFLLQAERWAEGPTGPNCDPLKLEIEPGTDLIWISDFLDNPLPSGFDSRFDLDALLRWGSSMHDQDGRFAGIHISIPEEFEQIGLGISRGPLIGVDRLDRTPADLRLAMGRRLDDLRRRFARANLPFASVSSEMGVQSLLEELDGSSVLGPGY